ncbi:Na+/H+ antiporter family-domain-containing protein [Syncephalis pseudoplumigaleata]|uniref:Na+/H+ antiporter family-domain-containing protein n=1 Tax=Syncephalis pseudoplumigaleata TaxID=1712513 RepID=A0A4P9YXR9_9FUNG|nr:Na+/H+ antiporter family-domain-containing protein [Syncephalis pseudoplumigaleata]|eukprot:RKP23760.1 Na+/H+ antiporter family-domain-containing protein [Syncephalis pseudoplumigaleata]
MLGMPLRRCLIALGLACLAATTTVAQTANATPAAPASNATTGLPTKVQVFGPKVALTGEEVTLRVTLTWPANETFTDAAIPYTVTRGARPGDPTVSRGTFGRADKSGALATEVELAPFAITASGAHSLAVHLGHEQARLDRQPAREPLPDIVIHALPGWITLLPIVVLIAVALISKQVLLALFCGVFLSAMFINFYNPLTGFLRAADYYMVEALSDPDHDKVLLFTWFLASLIALIQRSGGAEGLAQVVTRWATTRWRGLWVTFILGMVIFFDDFASCLIVGTNMVQVTDLLKISREKLAFFVHATSSPPASVAPVSSWIGYEVGLIADELRKLGNTTDPFMIFLKTIVGRFYPIFMIIFLVALNVLKRDFGPMLRAERRAYRTGQVAPDPPGRQKRERSSSGSGSSGSSTDAATEGGFASGMMQRLFRRRKNRSLETISEEMTEKDVEAATATATVADNDNDNSHGTSTSTSNNDEKASSIESQADEDIEDPVRPIPGKPRRWINAVLPIAINVFLIILGIFVTGYYATRKLQQAGESVSIDIATMAGNGDSYGALIYASLFTSIFSIILYKAQNILTVADSLQHWVVGIKEVFEPVLILTLAWAIGTALNELRTAHFIVGVLRGSLDPRIMPTLVFITSCVISFVTGTSWGTMAILFPLAIPLAAALQPGSEAAIVDTVASILTGAIFGDQCSPISGTSVMSALSSKCPLPAHVTTQLPYALVVALVSIVFGYLPVGFRLYPAGVAIPVGGAAIFVIIFLFGSKVELDENEAEETIMERIRGLFRRVGCACSRAKAALVKRK